MSELSLYNISTELQQLRDIAAYDEITPELEEQLAIKEEELATKMVGYKYIIAEFESQLALADVEIARIEDFKKRAAKAKQRLEGNMLQALLSFGEETGKDGGVRKIQVGTHTFSTRRSKRTEIINEEDVPTDYISYKVTVKVPDAKLNALVHSLDELGFDYTVQKQISRTNIKHDILQGTEVPGATLETYYSLSIR